MLTRVVDNVIAGLDVGFGVQAFDLTNPAAPAVIASFDGGAFAADSGFEGADLVVRTAADGTRTGEILTSRFSTSGNSKDLARLSLSAVTGTGTIAFVPTPAPVDGKFGTVLQAGRFAFQADGSTAAGAGGASGLFAIDPLTFNTIAQSVNVRAPFAMVSLGPYLITGGGNGVEAVFVSR